MLTLRVLADYYCTGDNVGSSLGRSLSNTRHETTGPKGHQVDKHSATTRGLWYTDWMSHDMFSVIG